MSEQDVSNVVSPEPSAPVPARPVRRVGTTTMGIVLIVAGIAVTAGLLNPDWDFSLLCKLSPLILVALGIEVLIASFTAKQAKLKYDFLSMLVCAFLILVSLCGAAASPLLQYCGPNYQRVVSELEDEWYDELFQKLSDVDNIQNFSCWLYMDEWMTANQVRQEGFDAVNSAHVYVELSGEYTDQQTFVDACQPVVEALRDTSVQTPSLEIRWENENGFYYLELDSPYAWQQADLAQYVNSGLYESMG